ncbi:thiol peroxidase [Nonlabens tegetincola]|uniref:Thiol peroxidase n=1 Tax=Nonlabens tegetincola TaxID=323273 RepID=A0A090Q5N4_9FLAO|nr:MULTISPECIES: thiol peroxidase [Nonlabens]ALM20070.1 thiol peroxidase [Nonlabens sp. MIC269]ARN70887.1 2-Cys peroxiredoxin [Nonlabens tegetincola]GAK97048.1 thiol peroxidase [Nonlabens tegetincola]
MATITLGGNEISTSGSLPEVGSQAPDFQLLDSDLNTKTLNDFKGKRLVLNIFPSIDTDTCATSVKNFNKRATELDNTAVLCISRDTPFAQKRFASDEDIENVTNLSDVITGEFGKNYGLEMTSGPLSGFHSRAVVVLDEEGKVIYNQQVGEIADEPDYLSALKSLL